MRRIPVPLVCLFLSSVAWGIPITKQQAVEYYAADASVVFAHPVSISSAKQPTADTMLVRQVMDAIAGIIASGAADIVVTARNGQIILHGKAVSQQVEHQLLEMASAVYGVKEVISEIKLSAS